MTYFDTELTFIPDGLASTQLSRNAPGKPGKQPVEVLGILLRLGNRPLVYSLHSLYKKSGRPASSFPVSDQDYYLVVHAISASRIQGHARVEELQYFATALTPDRFKTVDLVPKTRFNQILRAELHLSGCLGLFGEVALDIPSGIPDELLKNLLELAPGMHLQLNTSGRFIGRFLYSIQVPVVQASGIGSDSCCWILQPDMNRKPLLGDQLLVQTIAVPKGTRQVQYKLWGLVKADKGIFWKQQQQKTPEYIMDVDLVSAKSNQ